MSSASSPTPLVRRLALGGMATLATVALSALALEKWILWRNVWGVSYFEDVQRYCREAVEPVLPPDPEGQLFQNRPGVDLELRTFRYRTDALRLRRGEAPPTFDPERFEGLRILCVGDSVTLGWGVDDEETWLRLVEREAHGPRGEPVACLNAGHLMYDSRQEAELLDLWGPLLRPDVVLLTFVFNDLYPTWDQLTAMTEPPARRADGAPREAEPEAELNWRTPGWLVSLFPHLVQLGGYWRDERAFQADRMAKPPFSYYPSGWPRCEAALEQLAARCEALGARLVVSECNQYGPPLVELALWCERRGVPHFPITFTAAELARGVQNSRVDPHANALGNRLIADKVLAALGELGLIERAPAAR